MKVMVCGSRSIKELTEAMAYVLSSEISWDDVVVHGGAKGVDSLVQQWCEINNITTKVVRPVNESSPTSYLYRNCEMIGMCDKIIAIHDGVSTGTRFVINYAKTRDKNLIILHK